MKTARVGVNTNRWIEVSLAELKALARHRIPGKEPTIHLHVDSYLCKDKGFTTNQIGYLTYYTDTDRFHVLTDTGSNNATFQPDQIRTIQQHPTAGFIRINLVVGREEFQTVKGEEKKPGKHRYIPCLDEDPENKEPNSGKCDVFKCDPFVRRHICTE